MEVWTVDYRRRKGLGEQGRMFTNSRLPFPVVRFASNGRLTPGGLLSLAWGIHRRRRALAGRRVLLMSVGAQMAFMLLSVLGSVKAGKVTCFFHGSEILRFGRNRFWRWVAKRFYARADAFVVNSFYVEHLLRESGLLPKGAVVMVAPCACPTVFQVADAGEKTLVEKSVWRILTVARLHPRKGQLEVARALALLPASQRQRTIYQMVGAGDEAYRRQVADACREGGLRCEFLGALDDAALGNVYRHATVYAQASVTLPRSVEGFGITFLEASMHGCPVAAYRSGGVDEAVRDGETGLLVAEGDRAALAAALGTAAG